MNMNDRFDESEESISKDTIVKYLNIEEDKLLSYIELKQSYIDDGDISNIVESVKMLIEMALFSNDDTSTGIYKMHRIIPIEGESGMHDYTLVNKYFLDGNCRVECTTYKYNSFTSELEKYGSFDINYEEFIEYGVYEFINSIINYWQKITSNDMIIAITK